MKFTSILLASLLAFSASMASATTTKVHIAGSTAFRAATHNAIYHYLQTLTGYTVEVDYSGSTLGNATAAIFDAKNGAGHELIIYTNWRGSVWGIQDTAGERIVSWLDASNLTGTVGMHQIAGAPSFDEISAPEACMADSSQWESGCIGDCYASLLSQQVGVVPFVLVKGLTSNPAVAGILASVHNLSSMQLRILLGGGGVANPSDGAVAPLSQLTGDASAISYAAIVVGYNCGSGERLDTFLEAGFGVGPLSAPMQYLSGGEMLNDRLNGFQSPDALIAALNIPISAAHNFAVFSYLSIADAARLTSVRFNSSTGTFSGGPILTYNGVPFSYAAVCEGSYSLWNYEYLLSRRSLAGEQSTVIAGIGNQIATVDAAASGLLLDSMRVSRNSVTEVISTIASPAVD